MKWFRTHRKEIYLFIVGIFILGTFAGSGTYFLDRNSRDTAVIIGERKVPTKRFNAIVEREVERYAANGAPPLSEQDRQTLKNQIVQSLVEESVFLDQADEMGVVVTDTELARLIQTVPAFQTDGRFDPARYQAALAQARLTIPAFEAEQRNMVRIQKAQYYMASGIKVSPLEFQIAVQRKLETLKPAERNKFLQDTNAFREEERRRQIQSTFQDWYTVVSTQRKVRVLLDEPTAKPT